METLATKQIKELKVNLKKIEDVLNHHEKWEDEYWTYKLSLIKNEIIVKIYDGEECQEEFKIEPTILGDLDYSVKTICKTIINFIYENEINYRNNYINKTKSFNNRKIKSMALWMSKNNTDKIEQINNELIERYNTTKKMVNEVSYYKDYVRDMYNVLNELCYCWKIQDTRDYLMRKLEENRIENLRIYFTDTHLIVCKYKNSEDDEDKFIDRLEIRFDDFTNKNEILRTIINQFRKVA